MTNALHIRQNGKHSPFLPNNFYEAPQYASFRPIRIPLSVPATRAYSLPAPVIPASQKRIKERKTLRTVSVLFCSNGRMTGAKIDLGHKGDSPTSCSFFSWRDSARPAVRVESYIAIRASMSRSRSTRVIAYLSGRNER